jgi:NAD dependent epimerase/dehydratase family enzyme
MSWISVLDVVSVIDWLLQEDSIVGAVNLVSPNAISNLEFSRKIAAALGRPCFLCVPAFVLKLLLGQFADELLLSSQRAVPTRLLEAGYVFKHPTIDSAFEAFLCSH